MPKRFQWILNCVDDGTSYTLVNDPIGYEDCSFRMERHSTYHGIFNQFTSNLKFHNDGGGKQYIDSKYRAFDINGEILITVMIDSDGRGINYDTLFQGKINLASWQSDGLHTTVNIEQSDFATKLNTRADIPVPINVPVVTILGQAPFKAVIMDTYDPSTGGEGGTGTYIFEDPQILTGKIFKLVTLDVNNSNVGISLYFTIPNQVSSTVTGASGLSIQITNVVTGAMTIVFANLVQPVYLYVIGNQLSLGQNIIQPVSSVILPMQGIPIQYESEFGMTSDLASSTFTFIQGSDGWPGGTILQPGDLISVTVADNNGEEVYDQVMYAGINIAGPGNTSADGLTHVQITGVTSTSVSVSYTNINTASGLSLWLGTIGEVSEPNSGNGYPSGTILATYIPAAAYPTQTFTIPPNADGGGATIEANEYFGGYLGFDANTIFDNLGSFTFGEWNDIAQPAINNTNTNLPAICIQIEQPYIEYPIAVSYNINLKGTFTETFAAGFGDNFNRSIYAGLFLAYGGGQANASTNPIEDATVITLWENTTNLGAGGAATTETSYSDAFDTVAYGNSQGNFTLKDGDQIWLYAYITWYTPTGRTGVIVDLSFQFTQSNLDFKITEYAVPTTCEGVMIHEAFNQVTDMIGDTDGNFYSEFYGRTDSQKITYAQNGPGSERVITNGLCIRGHTDKYISVNLNDLFQSMAAIDNIGMEIDSQNRLRVEPLSFFFDPTTQIAELPNVYSFNTINENSLYYNQIEVGYDKWETELFFKNGLDEIHGKRYLATQVATAKGTILQKYGSDVKSLLAVSNKLTATSKIIAGNYAIELTRRKNYTWATDDFKYDNDNFIICVNHIIRCIVTFSNVDGNYLTILNKNVTDFLQPGDSFTVLGGVNNGTTFTVAESGQNEYGTLIDLNIAPNNETNVSVVLTLGNLIPETADSILIPPDGENIIVNVANPPLSTGWLNMSITPARMLQNVFNQIAACLQKIQGNIQFLNGEANFLAQTKFISTGTSVQQDYSDYTLAENASLSWDDANVENVTPLWVPEVYQFEYPITYQQFKAIRTNPNGYIRFYKFPQYPHFGFILSMEYNLKTGLTKFELLKMYGSEPILATDEAGIATEAEDSSLIQTGTETVSLGSSTSPPSP